MADQWKVDTLLAFYQAGKIGRQIDFCIGDSNGNIAVADIKTHHRNPGERYAGLVDLETISNTKINGNERLVVASHAHGAACFVFVAQDFAPDYSDWIYLGQA